jgi:hypothetical protein
MYGTVAEHVSPKHCRALPGYSGTSHNMGNLASVERTGSILLPSNGSTLPQKKVETPSPHTRWSFDPVPVHFRQAAGAVFFP